MPLSRKCVIQNNLDRARVNSSGRNGCAGCWNCDPNVTATGLSGRLAAGWTSPSCEISTMDPAEQPRAAETRPARARRRQEKVHGSTGNDCRRPLRSPRCIRSGGRKFAIADSKSIHRGCTLQTTLSIFPLYELCFDCSKTPHRSNYSSCAAPLGPGHGHDLSAAPVGG